MLTIVQARINGEPISIPTRTFAEYFYAHEKLEKLYKKSKRTKNKKENNNG